VPFEQLLRRRHLVFIEIRSRALTRTSVRVATPAEPRRIRNNRSQPWSDGASIAWGTSKRRNPCILYEVVCPFVYEAARKLTEPARMRK
jgi:hypothetical protein